MTGAGEEVVEFGGQRLVPGHDGQQVAVQAVLHTLAYAWVA